MDISITFPRCEVPLMTTKHHVLSSEIINEGISWELHYQDILDVRAFFIGKFVKMVLVLINDTMYLNKLEYKYTCVPFYNMKLYFVVQCSNTSCTKG
jgi:hypothetical protein